MAIQPFKPRLPKFLRLERSPQQPRAFHLWAQRWDNIKWAVSSHSSGTLVGWKYFITSMQIKTNTEVPFIVTLQAHWNPFYSSWWQGWKRIETCKSLPITEWNTWKWKMPFSSENWECSFSLGELFPAVTNKEAWNLIRFHTRNRSQYPLYNHVS